MRKNRLGLFTGTAALLLGGAIFVGCSDEDSDVNDQKGTGGQNEGGSGGNETGGTGNNTGGNDNLGGGGAGTGGNDNLGGDGSGTGGQTTVVPAAITELNSVLLTGINELKGLTYSSASCSPGKIFGSGYVGPTDATKGNRRIALVRLNEDGTLDTDFDGDGIVEFDAVPAEQVEESYGVVELPSCELLVVANVSDQKGGELIDDANVAEVDGSETDDDGPRPHGQDVVLIKFDEDGGVVTGFGTNGVKKVNLGWTDADDASWPVPTYNSTASGNKFSGAGFPVDTAWDLQLDPSSSASDPKVVLGAIGPAAKVSSGTQRTDNDRYIVRLSATTGDVDGSFNDGKPYTFHSFVNLNDNNRRILVEADGSIVAGGYTNLGNPTPGNHVVLIRLKKDGKPDASFDFGAGAVGAALFNPFLDDGGVAECYAVGKQSSGRYVTSGYGRATAITNPATASSHGWESSLANDIVSFGVLPGKLDTSYGVSGAVAIQSEGLQGATGIRGAFEQGHDMVVLSDDRIVHVGNFGSRPAVTGDSPVKVWNTPAIVVAGDNGLLDEGVGEAGFFLYPDAFAEGSNSQFYKVDVNAAGTRLVTSTNGNEAGVFVVVLKIGDE